MLETAGAVISVANRLAKCSLLPLAHLKPGREWLKGVKRITNEASWGILRRCARCCLLNDTIGSDEMLQPFSQSRRA